MINRRKSPDGLPFRVYERRGARIYSIGYKGEDGRWLFRLKCDVTDSAMISKLRKQAIARASGLDAPDDPSDRTFKRLAALWLKRQRALPVSSPERRADSTLDENSREIDQLNKAFAHLLVHEMEKADGYAYLDACLEAKDKAGKARPRPAKGNKEISLARRVLEYGVRLSWIRANPFDGIEMLKTATYDHLVTAQELALAVEVGRTMTAPYQIAALACKTAWLCVRRSVEVRAFTRDQITDAGIAWVGGKRRAGAVPRTALIEWSPDLRATIDEALGIQRRELAGSWYVFGNLDGQRYTKGGWKATMSKLMARCAAVAAERRIAFRPFSLQDCRPMGVTDKMTRGDEDTLNATLHTSDRMVRQVYDRRKVRVAKPAG